MADNDPFATGKGMMDLSGYEEATEYADLIPEGEYHLVCTNHDATKSKAGNAMWEIDLMVLGGDQAGCMQRDRIVFVNPEKVGSDPEKIKKARQAVSNVKHVLKRLGGVDTDKPFELEKVDMRGRQVTAYVKIKKGEINEATQQPYPDKNEIKMGSYREVAQEHYLPTNVMRKARPSVDTPGAGTSTPNGNGNGTATAGTATATAGAAADLDW